LGAVIIGTGISLPDNVVTNDDLALIMDTSDEWISTRTGVHERRFVDPGIGSSDLAIEASRMALVDAGMEPGDIDLLVTATMTPDYFAPGIAGQVQDGLGLAQVGAIDVRQQCSGFLYGLDVADSYLRSGKARNALVVGAEVHAGFLPWSDNSWRAVLGDPEAVVSDEERELNTEYRGWSVLFGDGAGAVVLTADEDPAHGLLESVLGTDGSSFELIWVPGIGFRHRPYASSAQIAEGSHLPVMDGGGLYRKAVRLMPQAVREVLERAGLTLGDVDVVVAHQANDRILDGVVRQLGAPAERVPSNIAKLGNTTAGTLPILYHQLRVDGRIGPGSLVCFTAFGAGAHYGAILYREPEASR
jgi:3-oxoacyl-[acyl-carrier-protein] synthase III